MALSLGHSSRRSWLATMTSREYAELVAFSKLEPLGYEREDARHGLAALHTISAWGGKTEIEHLMPIWQPPKAAMTDDEMFNLMWALPKKEQPLDGDDCKP